MKIPHDAYAGDADIMSVFVSTKNLIRNREFVMPTPSIICGIVAPTRKFLCSAHSVRSPMILAKIFTRNKYRAILDPRFRHDFSIGIPSNTAKFVVNLHHKSNLKTTVSRAWQEASGQNLKVDPTAYRGQIVEKSNANATHDGRILNGPIQQDQIDPDKVYQRLIDNSEADEVIDLRIAFHGTSIPLVYEKRRPIEIRFSNKNSAVRILEAASVFNATEQYTLLRFANLAGLDFGEADVLRDKQTGEIWVVDSTNGPAGPPNGLSRQDARRAIDILAKAFDDMLEENAVGLVEHQ